VYEISTLKPRVILFIFFSTPDAPVLDSGASVPVENSDIDDSDSDAESDSDVSSFSDSD